MDLAEENDNIAHEDSACDDDDSSSMDSDSSSVSSSDSDSMDSIDSSDDSDDDDDDDDVPREQIMLMLLKQLMNSPSASTSSRMMPQLMLLAQGNEHMLPQLMLLQRLQSKGELKMSNPLTMGIIMQMLDLF